MKFVLSYMGMIVEEKTLNIIPAVIEKTAKTEER